MLHRTMCLLSVTDTRNDMSYTTRTMTQNAYSMLDMMMNLQRLSLQAVSAYQPLVSAFLDSAKTAEHAARPSSLQPPTRARARSTANHMVRMRSR